MKKVCLSFFLLFLTFCLVGCNDSSDKVKKVIGSYEDYELVGIIDASREKAYQFNDVQRNEFKSVIEQLYNVKIFKKEVESSNNKKLNKTLLSKPQKPFIIGEYNFILGQRNEKLVRFNYKSDGSYESLELIVSAETENEYEILDRDAIYIFGRELSLYINMYFEETSFSNICNVFTGLNSSNIAKIETISDTSGTPPMGLLPHEYYESKQSIDLLIDYYLNSTLCVASANKAIMPGCKHVKMLIYTNYGSTYELDFYSGYLEFDNNYYTISTNAFVIAPDRINYSFDVNSASGEVYKFNEKVGDYVLDLSSLKLGHYDGNYEFETRFYFETQYAMIEFTNNLRFIRIHDVVYKVEEGIDVIEEIIAFAKAMTPED